MAPLPLLHVTETAARVTTVDGRMAGFAGTAMVLALALIWRDELPRLLRPRIRRAIAMRFAGLLVFFAVLTGARLAGVWGAIFGVPIVAVLTTMISFYRANQEERAARLLEHLPAEDLVSVGMSQLDPSDEDALISSGKGVARS